MALVAGLDLGSRTVRIAVVKTGLGAPAVVQLEERPITLAPDGSATSEEVALAAKGIRVHLDFTCLYRMT